MRWFPFDRGLRICRWVVLGTVCRTATPALARPHLLALALLPTSCRNDRVAEKGVLAKSQEPFFPPALPLPPSLFPLLNMIASTRDGTDNERKVSRCMTCCRATTFSRQKSSLQEGCTVALPPPPAAAVVVWKLLSTHFPSLRPFDPRVL